MKLKIGDRARVVAAYSDDLGGKLVQVVGPAGFGAADDDVMVMTETGQQVWLKAVDLIPSK